MEKGQLLPSRPASLQENRSYKDFNNQLFAIPILPTQQRVNKLVEPFP